MTRRSFPHVFSICTYSQDNFDSITNDHAHSQKAIDNPLYLTKVKEINDFMFSFHPKRCITCNNRWFVTKSKVPGDLKLDVLNARKNKSIFQLDDSKGTEWERCINDIPPDFLDQ